MANVVEERSTDPYAVFAPESGATHSDGSDVQPFELEGTIGLPHLLRAGRLFVGSRLRRYRPSVLAALLLLSLVGSAYGYWTNDPLFALLAAVQTAVLGLFVIAMTPRHGSINLKFLFLTGLQKPMRQACFLSAAGVRTVYSQRTLDDPWSHFSGFSEDDEMIILLRMGQYIPLAKDFCADEGEWQRLREFLYDRLPLRRP